MTTQLILYKDGEVSLEGTYVFSREKAPLLLLCHAWAGKDDFIVEKAQAYAGIGFNVFALDVYGKGIIGRSPEENASLKKPFLEDRNLLQRRLVAGYRKAVEISPSNKIAALGYGFGGLCALDLARADLPLFGAISVYGHFESFPEAKNITAKILILHGLADKVVPFDQPLKFAKSNNDVQLHFFSETEHAYMNPESPTFHPLSAIRSDILSHQFLNEIFLT